MRNNRFLNTLIGATLFSTAIFVVEIGAAGIERIECPERFGLWVTALPDGQVMTWWPEEKPGAADETGTVQSDDRGKTWRSVGQVLSGSNVAQSRLQLDEQSGVELADGRIWMLFRELHGGHLIDAFSADGGESWQDVRESRFVSPAAPPALLRLADGRILLVWNNSLKPKHVFNRLILAAAISDDEGRSWQGYREIARTSGASGPEGWVCYPFIAQTKDGTVVVSYGTVKFRTGGSEESTGWKSIQTRGGWDTTTSSSPTQTARHGMVCHFPSPGSTCCWTTTSNDLIGR